MVDELDYYVTSEDSGTRIRIDQKIDGISEDITRSDSISVDADLQPEHILWALLKNPEEEYLPYHYIKTEEWSSQWGAASGGFSVLVEIANNPWVTGLLGALIYDQGKAKVQDFFKRIKSADFTDEDAIYQAELYLSIKLHLERKGLQVHAFGNYELGAKWVELDHDNTRFRVAVAMTKRGKASIGIESQTKILAKQNSENKKLNKNFIAKILRRFRRGASYRKS